MAPPAAPLAPPTAPLAAPPPDPLWGVLDCARDARLHPFLMQHPGPKACLFEEPEADLAAAAPWLVGLPEDSPLCLLWQNQGQEAHWGLLFRSARPLDDLRRDLRRRLLVTLPNGQRAIYRFYDPRVAAAVNRAQDQAPR